MPRFVQHRGSRLITVLLLADLRVMAPVPARLALLAVLACALVALLASVASARVINGGPLADRLVGGPAPDTLRGNGSRDTLLGGGGNDVLTGGFGADRLFGGFGDDRLDGGSADDLVDAGDGNDDVYGAACTGTLARDRSAERSTGGRGDVTWRSVVERCCAGPEPRG